MKPIKLQRGVSLVEALVALVVMSIGMLGIAALYIESVKANRGALLRTQAVALVLDMADRIRANRLARGTYALALGAAPPATAELRRRRELHRRQPCRRRPQALGKRPCGRPPGMPWNGATPPQTGVLSSRLPARGCLIATRSSSPGANRNQAPAEPDYRYQLNMQLIPTTPT